MTMIVNKLIYSFIHLACLFVINEPLFYKIHNRITL